MCQRCMHAYLHTHIHTHRYKAVDDHVASGMVVGLGTGSTAYFAGKKTVEDILIEQQVSVSYFELQYC